MADTALASLYTGAGAQHYHDLCLHDTTEVQDVLEALAEIDDPALDDLRVLEMASGSGRVTLPMAAAGHRVLATDLSEDMLDILRSRLTERAALRAGIAQRVEVRCADMTTFTAQERFRAVCLPTVSITLLRAEQQRRALERAAHHLAPGGRLVLSTTTVSPQAPTSITTALGDGVSLTEEVDRARGTRRTVLTWGGETFVSELHLAPAPRITVQLTALGLEILSQRPTRGTPLSGHGSVLIVAERPRGL